MCDLISGKQLKLVRKDGATAGSVAALRAVVAFSTDRCLCCRLSLADNSIVLKYRLNDIEIVS